MLSFQREKLCPNLQIGQEEIILNMSGWRELMIMVIKLAHTSQRESGEFNVKCDLCKTEISVGNLGFTAIKRHSARKVIKELLIVV